jgi:hypothetical protein
LPRELKYNLIGNNPFNPCLGGLIFKDLYEYMFYARWKFTLARKLIAACANQNGA